MAYTGKPVELIETEKELIREYGKRMNLNQICYETGIKNWNSAKEFIQGIKPLVWKGKRYYKTSEIAERIWLNTEEEKETEQ